MRELCRLLGLPRGIGELGCVHLEGNEVRYELGDFPFVGETPVEVALRHMSEPPPPLPSSVPPAVRSLVQRALAKEPTDRPRSPAELRAAIAAR